jgi:hypothetical protein
MNRFWIWRTYNAPTTEVGAYSITPIAQLIGVRWRGGGWLWQFPLAVEVETEGTHERLPIPYVTRTAIWLLYGLFTVALLIGILTLWRTRRQRRKS